MVKKQKSITIGLFNLEVSSEIYTPGEDTFLLEDIVRKEINDSTKKISVCYELGCGSGYLSLVIKSVLKDSFLFASDINPKSVEITKFNLKKNNLDKNSLIFVSDLLDNYNQAKIVQKNKKIDLMIFNPPYIPGVNKFSSKDQLETALIGGGTTGDDIIIRFLDALLTCRKEIFSKFGKLIILISSWNKKAKELIETEKKFNITHITKKKISHETLYCYVITFF